LADSTEDDRVALVKFQTAPEVTRMGYINVGAKTVDGERIPTKAALRRLLLGDKKNGVEPQPSEVLFDVTSLLGPCVGETFRGDALPPGYTLQVVGPDPYAKRLWYAGVSVNTRGISVR
jgi:hypothetical protein